MMQRQLNCLLVGCLFTSLALGADDGNWPRFRGPNGAGVSDVSFPVSWTAKDYRWSIDLPGNGTSSPVVWGDRVFVTSADAESGKRYVQCLDADTGRELWRHAFDISKAKQNLHRLSTHANNTPAVDAERLYVLWQDPDATVVHAFDHDGKALWRTDIGPYESVFGAAGSPIVHDGMVIVAHDQNSAKPFRVALDAATGEVRWKHANEGGKPRDCFGTPVVFQPSNGPTQVVFTHCYRGFLGVDPKTGDRLWSTPGIFGDHNQRALTSPVVFGDLVIATSGFARGKKNLVALRPPMNADAGGKVVELYRHTDDVPYVPTPVIYNDHLFLWEDEGTVRCVDPLTGKTLGTQRLRFRGKCYTSPIVAGGRLYGITQSGQVFVLAATPSLDKLGEVDLGEETLATPAVGRHAMFIRTAGHLHALPASTDATTRRPRVNATPRLLATVMLGCRWPVAPVAGRHPPRWR